MEQVVAFSRYVGLVVAVFAALLVAPRATSAAWAYARRGFRAATEVDFTPVRVREGVRTDGQRHLRHFHGDDPLDQVEVLDTHGPRHRTRRARLELAPALELVDSRAVLVLLTGLLLVFAGDLVRLLPGGAVMTGDLVLVVVTFLVMRHVIYTYVPVERLDLGRPLERAHAPFDQVMRLVLLSVAVTLLATWPSQVGWQLASHSLGGELRDQRVVVAWACELPWLLGLAWFVARQRVAATSPARPTR
ncbi:MAG: hypothetical protein JWO22_66 [Frankiales bacterium]|nr:hypothetical protein [Frankiales bacterium]